MNYKITIRRNQYARACEERAESIVDEIDTNQIKDVLSLISSYRIHLITKEQKEAFFNAEIETRRMERKVYHVTDSFGEFE